MSKSPLEIIREKMKEQGLSEDDLEKHGIFRENIDPMSWETAVKLSKLLGEEPGFWLLAYWKREGTKGGLNENQT